MFVLVGFVASCWVLVLANSDDGDEPACWSLVIIWLSSGAMGSAIAAWVPGDVPGLCFLSFCYLLLCGLSFVSCTFTRLVGVVYPLVGMMDSGKEVASTHALHERAGNEC